MLNRQEHALAAGSIGENLVANFFPYAEKTDDWFDHIKDGRIGHMKYEVKTLRLNKRDQGFWIEQNQFWKLDGVDILIFVNIPENRDDNATLYLFNNHKDKSSYDEFVFKGKNMRNYKLTNCIALCIIDNTASNQLFEHSNTMRTYK
jgi:hypothetical protein